MIATRSLVLTIWLRVRLPRRVKPDHRAQASRGPRCGPSMATKCQSKWSGRYNRNRLPAPAMEDLKAHRHWREVSPEPTQYAVPAVGAAARAMELIVRAPDGVGLSDLARQLALPKSTLRNVLVTLRARGWLEYDPAARRYRMGQAFAAVARVAASHLDPLTMIKPHMERLAALTRLTCAVAERLDDGFIIQAKAESPDAVRVTVVTGERQQWGAGALARALLSGVPDTE